MELNRIAAFEKRFRETFERWDQAVARHTGDPDEPARPSSTMTKAQLLSILQAQLRSRAIDIVARELKKTDDGFYTIASAGHEGDALIALYARPTDPAFLHYRSGAFVMMRAAQVPGETPIYDACLSLVAAREDPIAGGRHKVWGSKSLEIPPQTSTIASHLPKAVGAALAIEKARSLDQERPLPHDSIVICSFGDASLNHSTAQGAINTAAWAAYQNLPMPLLFVCEDNGIGISVETPRGWVEASMKARPGIDYRFADGLDALGGADAVRGAIEVCRARRRPVFLHLRTVRLFGHAGSDPEHTYRSAAAILADEDRDPVLKTASLAVSLGLLGPAQMLELYDQTLARARAAGARAATRPKQESAASIAAPLAIDTAPKIDALKIDADKREEFWRALDGEGGAPPEQQKPRHMAKLINLALHDLLLEDPRILVFGEDVARKKGGVYTVTRELSARFGHKRVFNTLLDEQAILGVAIGTAQMGFLPIPEIQYLAYIYNAIDQVRGEACSLKFFSEGQFLNPMVIRIASFAYQRGFGGHFHNDNGFASLREIPGLVIAAPATGADAVTLLRRCVRLADEQGLVVAFMEPIALYMTKDLLEPGDGLYQDAYPPPDQIAQVGEPAFYGPDNAPLLIISYANGAYLSRQAQAALGDEGITARVMDLRWLKPLNRAAIAEAAGRAERVLIVDEGRRTGGISEEIFCLLCEELGGDAGRWRRVVGDDSYIPLGKAWAHVLPSKDSIIEAARALCKGART